MLPMPAKPWRIYSVALLVQTCKASMIQQHECPSVSLPRRLTKTPQSKVSRNGAFIKIDFVYELMVTSFVLSFVSHPLLILPLPTHISTFRAQQHLLIVSSVNVQFGCNTIEQNSKEWCVFLLTTKIPRPLQSVTLSEGDEAKQNLRPHTWDSQLKKPWHQLMTKKRGKDFSTNTLSLVWEPGPTNNGVQQHLAGSWYEQATTVARESRQQLTCHVI